MIRSSTLLAVALCVAFFSVPVISFAAPNGPEQATVLDVGDTWDAHMTAPGDVHWYRITPTAEDIQTKTNLAFDVSGKTDLNIDIYRDLASAKTDDTYDVYRHFVEQGKKRTIEFPIAWHGPYYIKVTHIGEEGAYRMSTASKHRIPVDAGDDECAIELAVKKQASNKALLTTLRGVRDELLAGTPKGKRITSLYYQTSPFLIAKLVRDQTLRNDVYTDLVTLQPVFHELATNGEYSTYRLKQKEVLAAKQLYSNVIASLPINRLKQETTALWNELRLSSAVGKPLGHVVKAGGLAAGNRPTDNEIIVKVKNTAKAKETFKTAIEKKVRTLGHQTDDIQPLRSADGKTALPRVYIVKLNDRGAKGPSVKQIAKRLNQLPEIEYAEPNGNVHMYAGDVHFPYEWSLENRGDEGYAGADINFTRLEKALADKPLRKTTIAVVDSGVNHTFADFAGVVRDDLGRNFHNQRKTAMDDNDHGTHIAGVIAATGNNGFSMAGVHPNVEILPVKVLNSWGGGSIDRIALGIKYAVDQGAKVINLSLGFEESRAVEETLKYAADRNVTVIAAAGNEATDEVSYPASSPYTIAVGSTMSLDTLSEFSNYGKGLDVVAPGTDIPSLVRNGNVRTMSGTSMAAPHAAAVAGLLYSVRPDITPEQVREYFHKYSHDLGEKGYDEVYGWGRLDAFKVFSAADLNLRLNEMKVNHKAVSGNVQPGASVTVKRGKTVLSEGKANKRGAFSVKIPQQKAGTTLIIEAKDARGVEWTSTTVQVKQEKKK